MACLLTTTFAIHHDHLVYSTPPYHTHCVYIVYYISRLGCAHAGQAVFTSIWCLHNYIIHFLTLSFAVAIILSSLLPYSSMHIPMLHPSNHLSFLLPTYSVAETKLFESHLCSCSTYHCLYCPKDIPHTRVPVIFTTIWYNNNSSLEVHQVPSSSSITYPLYLLQIYLHYNIMQVMWTYSCCRYHGNMCQKDV